MSMVAIFSLSCCERLIVHGRFQGSDENKPTTAKCYFGCKPKRDLRGNPVRFKLTFVTYRTESMVPEELLDTWLLKNRTGDLWHKYNRDWLKRKEALGQGAIRGV